jgi:hypothetical protein
VGSSSVLSLANSGHDRRLGEARRAKMGRSSRSSFMGAASARKGTMKESSRRRIKTGRRGHMKKCGQKEKCVILKEITHAKSDESR